MSVTILSTSIPVYNIEVHGEHVFHAGEAGLLVHNASPARCAMIAEYGDEVMKGWQAAHIIPKNGWSWTPKQLGQIINKVTKVGRIDDLANLFSSTPGHAGTHAMRYMDDVIVFKADRNTRESLFDGINILWVRTKAGRYP